MNRRYERAVLRIAAQCRSVRADAINRWLKHRLTQASSVTVHYERGVIITLLKWAYETNRISAMPRGIVKIKAVKPPTRAWTVDQCCTGVKGTFALDHQRMRSGCSLGLFLRCWMLLGYETGARPGDLWKMRKDDFLEGAVQWSQNKTGQPVAKVLSQHCLRACQEMLRQSPDGTVLGWAIPQDSGRRVMRKYLLSLSLPGSPKWLRRSSATHIEAEQPGKGKVHLGHLTPGLFERFYADWSQIRRDIPQARCLIKE